MIHHRIIRQEVSIPGYMMKYYEGLEEEKNYKTPPIPKGFCYVGGKWNNGFTIMNENDGSLFVWQPKMAMKANSSSDGFIFNKRFGRNVFDCFNDDRYQIDWFYDDMISTKCKEIVEKTGGNYISAHIASYKNNNIVFRAGEEPMLASSTKIEALTKRYARDMVGVLSMPVSGADFDCMVKYFMMQSNDDEDLLFDSSKWNSRNSKITGEKISHYGFFDLGMHSEFTTENNSNFYVVRGSQKAVASRMLCDWKNRNKNAFRVVLYVEHEEDPFEKEMELLNNKLKENDNYSTNTQKVA